MAPTTSTTSPPAKAKKPRKKKDPNAPAGVTSAYTWFFRATQATIKEKNPGAKFGDISKIVASMWEALGDNEKTQYKKQNEEDKIRHKREMEAYNAGVSFKKICEMKVVICTRDSTKVLKASLSLPDFVFFILFFVLSFFIVT